MTLVAAYLAFALLVGSWVLGVDVRIRHAYLLALAAGLVVDAAAGEAGDPTLPVQRLYPPMFHPTARNFTMYRPGFQSAGAVYGDRYRSEFRRSPTLMGVLERR